MRKFLTWVWRLLIIAVCCLILVTGGAASYQVLVTRNINRRHPPPGTLVDVGGHKLHIHCQGHGNPVVVIDAGLSGASYDWEEVAKRIASFTRVCTYDRAGYGWSEPGPRPRTSQQAMAELRELVRRAEIPAPFILVAHSWAGLHARLYASQYPGEIAGLILVDSVNLDRLPETTPGGQVSTLFKFINATAFLGTARYAVPRFVGDPENDPEARKFRWEMLSRTKSAHAIYDELAGQANWLQVRAECKHLGDKPVVVISRGIRMDQADRASAEIANDWMEDQRALCGISKDSKLIVATTSNHNIQFHEPTLIVNTVHSMVESLKPGWAPQSPRVASH